MLFEGEDISKLGAPPLRPLRREMQMIFQDPYASLNPRKRVGSIIGDPLKIHGVGKSKRAQAGPGAPREGRPLPGALQPLPARVLGRPAAADRRRPGPGPQSEADRGRRARLGSRRLDPVADAESPGRPPEGALPHLHLHRARPRRRPPRERPDRGDVPGEARRALAGRGSLQAADHALHRGAPLGRADPGSRSRPRSGSGSSSRATSRARSTRPRAAASIHGAAT